MYRPAEFTRRKCFTAPDTFSLVIDMHTKLGYMLDGLRFRRVEDAYYLRICADDKSVVAQCIKHYKATPSIVVGPIFGTVLVLFWYCRPETIDARWS
jgi:hypothetical protein